uniref:Lysophospholipid acyltransferase n=1 Tax=Rhodosorus marinus TaxID=101924 RepID=A0A7S2ZXJ8_9RHOD|mmetsp:Transcript_36673/g.146608  ORF Transcript_36673/g.146608 Transcript_36673/m.146608 type:complete len:252 (+) Transcript_36673:1212-1967(+)
MAMFYFGLSEVLSSKYPTQALLSDEKFLTSGNVFTRFGIQLIALIGYRTRYYFAWKFSEGAIILSGIGFNGIDKDSGEYKWDRVEVIDVPNFDFAQSLRQASAAWNKTTNYWLKRYTYDRIPPPLNLYFTFLVSAFWHGFYPGYYMFFMSIAVGTAVHRKIRRNVRPWFLAEDGKSPGKYKGVYDLLSFVLTHCTLMYFIISFAMLSWEASIRVFRSQYFIGHILAVVLYIVLSLGIIRPPKRTASEKKTQ